MAFSQGREYLIKNFLKLENILVTTKIFINWPGDVVFMSSGCTESAIHKCKTLYTQVRHLHAVLFVRDVYLARS